MTTANVKYTLYFCQQLDPSAYDFGQVQVCTYDVSTIHKNIKLLFTQDHEQQVVVPDPRTAAIELLEEKAATLKKETAAELLKIEDTIGKLLALEGPTIIDPTPIFKDDIPF